MLVNLLTQSLLWTNVFTKTGLDYTLGLVTLILIFQCQEGNEHLHARMDLHTDRCTKANSTGTRQLNVYIELQCSYMHEYNTTVHSCREEITLYVHSGIEFSITGTAWGVLIKGASLFHAKGCLYISLHDLYVAGRADSVTIIFIREMSLFRRSSIERLHCTPLSASDQLHIPQSLRCPCSLSLCPSISPVEWNLREHFTGTNLHWHTVQCKQPCYRLIEANYYICICNDNTHIIVCCNNY